MLPPACHDIFFFSNCFVARTSSCQTFDSLDFARYSDDGDRAESDKVAGEYVFRHLKYLVMCICPTYTKSELSLCDNKFSEILHAKQI